jgi:hypothetical protein
MAFDPQAKNKEEKMICPKCGFSQPDTSYCANCGVSVEKFRRKRRNRRMTYLLFFTLASSGYFALIHLDVASKKKPEGEMKVLSVPADEVVPRAPARGHVPADSKATAGRKTVEKEISGSGMDTPPKTRLHNPLSGRTMTHKGLLRSRTYPPPNGLNRAERWGTIRPKR